MSNYIVKIISGLAFQKFFSKEMGNTIFAIPVLLLSPVITSDTSPSVHCHYAVPFYALQLLYCKGTAFSMENAICRIPFEILRHSDPLEFRYHNVDFLSKIKVLTSFLPRLQSRSETCIAFPASSSLAAA